MLSTSIGPQPFGWGSTLPAPVPRLWMYLQLSPGLSTVGTYHARASAASSMTCDCDKPPHAEMGFSPDENGAGDRTGEGDTETTGVTDRWAVLAHCTEVVPWCPAPMDQGCLQHFCTHGGGKSLVTKFGQQLFKLGVHNPAGLCRATEFGVTHGQEWRGRLPDRRGPQRGDIDILWSTTAQIHNCQVLISAVQTANSRQGIQRVGLHAVAQVHEDVIQQTVAVLVGGQDIHMALIHISEPTRLGMISYAVFCLKKKKKNQTKRDQKAKQNPWKDTKPTGK